MSVYLLVGIASVAHSMTLSDPPIPRELRHYSLLMQKIHIPTHIAINHASAEELQCLPGVSKALAQSLIRHRPYRNGSDFARLPELSEAKARLLYTKIANRIAF
jgi:hypothetical protein